MFYLLGTITGLLFIIMCCTNALKQINAQRKCKPDDTSAINRKRELKEEDLHLLIKILAAGLVDADPTFLQHLKCFRDLRGGST